MEPKSNRAAISHPGQEGLDLVVSCTKKNYIFTHGNNRTFGESGAATLGGLYDRREPDAVEGDNSTSALRTTESIKCEAVVGGDPTDNQRNNLSYAIDQIPNYLQQIGVVRLDNQLNEFHKQVRIVKNQLVKKQVNGVIPAATMRSAEEFMTKYNCQGYMVRITGHRISKANPKGSKQRRDGLYVTTKVIRSFYVNRMLTVAELQAIADHLLKSMAADEVTGVTQTAGYVITRNPNGQGTYYAPVTNTQYQTQAGTKNTRSRPGGMRT